MPLNFTPKSGYNGKFYVMYQKKKDKEQGKDHWIWSLMIIIFWKHNFSKDQS